MAISSKRWLAVLLNENGASYYIDDNGMLQTQLTPKPLPNMFEGWADIVLNYGRSAKYFGLERSYTSTYTFVKDGAKILRSLMYGNRGIESKVYIGLLRWNGQENDNYELYYKAEIDLAQAEDNPKTGVTVEVMQDGPAKYIKVNEAVTYTIPCSGLTLNLDGIRYTDTFHYFTAGLAEIETNTQWIVPVNFINNEGENVNVQHGDSYAEQIFGDIETALTPSGNYFFSSLDTLTALVKGTFTIEVADDQADIDLSFYTYPQSAPFFPKKTIYAQSGVLPGTYTIPFEDFVAVGRNGKLFLFLNIIGVGVHPKVTLLETKFTFKFDSRFQKTTTFAKRPIDLFKDLVKSLTDNKFTGASQLLEDNAHLVAASSDAIRGLDNPQFRTSFSDFYNSYGKILKGAVGVNYNTQEILFETKEYFMDNATEIIDLGEVSEMKVSIAKDIIFSSIKSGYPNQKSEEAVAREEVNATQERVTPITRLQKVLDLVSVYRTDIHGLERLRQQFFDLTKTDSKSDNDIFIINIERTEDPDGGWNVYRPAYDAITGGSNLDTWYNLEQLTPATIVETNGSYIRSSVDVLRNDLIRFTSADKNTALIRTLAGKTTAEAANFRISDLAAPYATPFLFNFKAKIDQNVVSLLQQAGRGYVTGTYQGYRFYGFPQDVSVKPVFDESQEWTLLGSSLTSLDTLLNLNNQGIIIENMGIISHKLPFKLLRVDESYSLKHHFKQMDTDWFANRISRYDQHRPFFQPWQTNDLTDIQFITQGLSVAVQIIDCNGTVLHTVTMTETANPAISNPKQLWLGTMDWSNIQPNTTCYVLASFGIGPGMKQFVSEPMLVKTDWPGTLLFECSNDSNQTDMIWNVDYVSRMRVPGYIQKFKPGGRLSQYEDQPLDVVNLEGEPTRAYELLIEEVPDWVIDKLNRLLKLSDTEIDGFAYTLDKDAELEPLETVGAPMVIWTTRIREANNKAGIAIDATGELQTGLSVQYNINTKGFSSNQSPANQQDTIIQITEIE